MNLNASPQRHRGTEKSLKTWRYARFCFNPKGEPGLFDNTLFLLCVSVPLWFQSRFSG